MANTTNHRITLTSNRSPSALLAKTPSTGRWLSATYILIGINVLVFSSMLAYNVHQDGLLVFLDARVGARFDLGLVRRWGGAYGPDTLGGDYWRLITSSFVHSGLSHLFGNMLFLWFFGRALDRLLGGARTFVIYLLAGIGASLASLSWHPTTMGYGASGAGIGIRGALISLTAFADLGVPRPESRRILLWAALAAAFTTISAMFSRGVADAAGHAGGLVSGLLIGVLLAWTYRSKAEQRLVRQRWVLVMAGTLLAAFFVVLIRVRSDVVELSLGQRAMDRNDRSAVRHVQNYVLRNSSDSIGHVELARAYYQFQQYDEAAGELRRALELDPNSFAAQHHLAIVYTYFLNRPEEAVSLFKRSLPRIAPDSDDYVAFADALRNAGKLEEAEVAARKAVALNPKSATPHELLAAILGKLGKTDQAAIEYELARRLGARN